MDKTFDAAEAEPRIYARWESEGRFRAGANARPGAEPFCIVIPPPNVTGSLHMGHALNNTLQDVLVRWKRMQGFDVLWQPGQDHAGIATQMVVERKLAEAGEPGRREMGREPFVERVWRQKDESGDTIIRQLKRLGASCDWERNAFTLGRTEEDPMSRAALLVFKRLYDEGLIYRDKRLVNWDPHFETAISDLEVEQVEVQGKLWRFRYPLEGGETYRAPVAWDEEGNPAAWEERDYIVVATTRPETMLGDTGVAVHPEDERYAHLVGKHVVLPLVGRRIPIVADDYADPETGTGAVKITPAHDFNDFQVGKRCGLRTINVMGPRATITLEGNADFLDGAEPSGETMTLDGLDRYEARKRVVAMFEAAGLLDGIDEHVHQVPHGDRSKVAVEPYLTDQWFVNAAELAKPAMAAVREGRTVFHPENWAKTYFQWLENIEPWCVSRQLWWGHRVPVWYGPKARSNGYGFQPQNEYATFCAISEEEAITAAKKHYNRDVIVVAHWLEALARFGDALNDNSKPFPIYRDEDVLDTWFSSALWPFSTMGWPDETPELKRYYPTSVLSTGFDIIFFWVARMMMCGLHFMKEVPFRDVYIHALVRDEKGRKMSKSLGNVIDPITLIDQYGADAVRMTLTAMAAMGRDLKLDVSRVEGYRNFSTKLWNAARFAEMNGCAPVPFDPRSPKQPVNRWIVGETARLRETVDAALTAYRFNDAANALYAHVWGVYCDWYLELAKPLLQGEDEAAKAETQATAAWALDQLLILLHPVMPFVTEALWQARGERDAPLVHAAWPDYRAANLADPAADAELGWIVGAIEGVRSARADVGVPPGAQIPLVVVGADEALRARVARAEVLMGRLARLSSIDFAEEAPKGAATVAVEGATLCLPLAGVIDVGAERARLEKALGKVAKEIDGLDRKLSNDAFLAKAPEAVVAEQRTRREAAAEEAAKLEAALERLKALG